MRKDFIQNEVLLNSDGTSIGEIITILKNFELLRLEHLKHFQKVCWWVLVGIVLFGVCCFMLLNCNFQLDEKIFKYVNIAKNISIGLLICYIIILPFYARECNKKFVRALKTQSLKKVLALIGDIKYSGHDKDKKNPSNQIMKNLDLMDSGLFLPYNIRYIDDEFSGNYLDVPFKISETRFLDEHKSLNKSSSISIPIFKGVLISFDFNKVIKNRTVVSTKGDWTSKNLKLYAIIVSLIMVIVNLINFFDNTDSKNKKQNESSYAFVALIIILIPTLLIMLPFIVIKVLREKNHDEPLNEIKLEDTKFEKRFNVYSSDEIEARYLVTPAFMERFYNLKTAFGARKVKCSFSKEQLLIAIYTNKNLFEIGGLFRPLGDIRSVNRFYKEITSICKMVEYFKLNEKIYLK